VAAGRIQNKVLLDLHANILNLEGVKRFPPILDLSDIKAVYNLSQPTAAPSAEGVFEQHEIGNNPINGVTRARYYLIETNNGLDPAFGRRVDAMTAVITFDAAGQTAFNGKLFTVTWGFNEDGGDPGWDVPIYQARCPVINSALAPEEARLWIPVRGSANGGQGGIFYGNASTWNGRIPAGVAFWIEINSPDGTNFPANTTLNNYTAWRVSTNTVVPIE